MILAMEDAQIESEHRKDENVEENPGEQAVARQLFGGISPRVIQPNADWSHLERFSKVLSRWRTP